MIPEKINSSLRVLLLRNSENSLTKRVANALKERKVGIYMSRDMRFPTMWHFDKFRLRRACAASFLA